MDALYPRISRRHLPAMLGIAFMGAVGGGLYGIVHDQFTYSLSPEYFTQAKFAQFHWANFGLPERVMVAEVGFIGTWWVGAFAGWFLARMSVPHGPRQDAWRLCVRGMIGTLAMAVFAGLLAYAATESSDFEGGYWQEMFRRYGVADTRAFAQVACIHYAGYAGGLAGLVGAMAVVRVLRRRRVTRTP